MNKFKENLKKTNLGTFLALIVLIVLVSVINPGFLQANNLLNLLKQLTVNGFIAFGMTFVILSGGIDLSVGSILALSSVLTLGLYNAGVGMFFSILIGILLGGILGMINGILITKGKLAPFIVTLAAMTIYRGMTLIYTNGRPIAGDKENYLFKFLGRGLILNIPFPVILFFIAFAILYIILNKTAFGRKVYAVGGNEKASFISGINTDKVKIIIYTISGVMASIAGLILASRLNSAGPQAGVSYEMDAIAAVVLGGSSMTGGKGRLSGTLIGAIILGVLNNGLNLLGVSSFYQQIVKGIVILLAVLIDRKRNK